MANVANKIVVTSETATFGTATLKFQSAPSGIGMTTELPDITCCDDVEQRFAPAACVEDAEFTIRLGGTPPAPNTKAALTLSQEVSTAGATPTTKSVSCGQCILTKIVPVDITAAGDRVQWYECTFRPDGTRS